MAITNGYTTLQNIKDLLNPLGMATNTTDDSVIERLVEGASRLIDTMTGRTFYARTETRLFDVPSGVTLFLDDDLISVSTLTNGDTTVLTTSDYRLLPANTSPKFAIKLKESSTYSWEGTSAGNNEAVISVAGSWGWSASVVNDIRMACEMIVNNVYRNRYGTNTQGAAQVTGAGVIITPQDVPSSARVIIESYRRVVIGVV